MRFTIERIRTLVLIAAALLLGALGLLLARAKLKNVLNRHDLPQRLAKEIQQEANGFDYVHALGSHLQYKIHASKEVQLRNDHIELHEVRIELFGEDGSRVDQIAGDTFVYDQKSGLAIAEGPVDMVLTRPTSKGAGAANKENPVPASAGPQIHVKTSGVTFDRDTGLVSTAQRVDFNMAQGAGSATGAVYDSQSGHLTLEKDVELVTRRGTDSVTIHASYAEFDRTSETCLMRAASAIYRNEQADAGQAKILFRQDGSASRLDATGGFTLATQSGGHVAAPTGSIDFDKHNQPTHGNMDGGVAMDSVRADGVVHGTSPTAALEFTSQGQLRHVHLERGVAFSSEETITVNGGKSATQRIKRSWRSPMADIEFRDVGKGQVEPASLHGTGGVTIASESQRGGGIIVPSKMTADEITGTFGSGETLRSMTGSGHASLEQTTAAGTLQTASGDRLTASFLPAQATQTKEQKDKGPGTERRREEGNQGASAAGLQSAELDGHVVLFEQPAPKNGHAEPPMRATAGKAVYEGGGEWLHLTIAPRVVNGGLELAADKVDVSQQSGDAFAHGDVKATWSGAQPGRQNAAGGDEGRGGITLGGKGPAHVIAAEAQVNQSTGEATFRGHARLWQETNAIAGPLLVLNQHTQTLTARSDDAPEPVRAVLLNANGVLGKQGGQPSTPAVIRVRGGDLWYSDTEHRAVMRGGALGTVVAETSTATSTSDVVELRMMPAGIHEDGNGRQTQVDRMIATGHVVLTSQGRRGTGERLLYTGASGDYVLTGTASAPPRLTDPERGNVTGETLIFHSRDDSVSIEGGGRETRTETTAPDAHGKQ